LYLDEIRSARVRGCRRGSGHIVRVRTRSTPSARVCSVYCPGLRTVVAERGGPFWRPPALSRYNIQWMSVTSVILGGKHGPATRPEPRPCFTSRHSAWPNSGPKERVRSRLEEFVPIEAGVFVEGRKEVWVRGRMCRLTPRERGEPGPDSQQVVLSSFHRSFNLIRYPHPWLALLQYQGNCCRRLWLMSARGLFAVTLPSTRKNTITFSR
jgi:hypothetical protein